MKNIVFLSFFLCLIMACAKEGPPGPKGPDGPPYTWPPGNITGYVELRNQGGFVIERADSVLLQTYNGDSIFRAYTDTNGYFNLKAVPPGNYDISLTKPGFDSLHMYVQHAGGVIDKFTGTITMNEHVTTTLVSLTAVPYRDRFWLRVPVELVFNWLAPPSTLLSGIIISLDTSSVPGSGRSLGWYGPRTVTDIDGIRGKVTQLISIDTFYVKQSKVYLTAAAVPAVPSTQWFNYATGSQVPYPYLGDSIKTQITYTED
ncbi:carboxypeptidase-like regulatory domain-containing protein [Chitinophaga sp. S165]|uniref:carboxypeptidase-like regulatory domain-containing protein n=1 Tax=Chitinophaga sp. S165 TaxID=2135462 RepID=UPI000D71B1F5|nr:carboxypeptidase-like regulatory domain-containing protein [Chitinophaga sp. S165]PWV48154.1 carboxypeptidase family protein [Chitinophaga sp. S165]